MSKDNTNFELPPETAVKPAVETDLQRVARLRARAEAQALSEFNEDAVYAQLLAEARAARLAELSTGVEFALDTRGFPEDYDWITIFRGQKAEDKPYVELGINGFVIKAPRDEKIILPHAFVEVLEHAIEEITIRSQGGLVTRPAHRFPFNFIKKATTAEYQAFQAEQREKAARQTAQAA